LHELYFFGELAVPIPFFKYVAKLGEFLHQMQTAYGIKCTNEGRSYIFMTTHITTGDESLFAWQYLNIVDVEEYDEFAKCDLSLFQC